MMTYEQATCPVCGNPHASGRTGDAQRYQINCLRCGADTTVGLGDASAAEIEDYELPEFNPFNYDWVSIEDQCPDEPGLYLADLLEGRTTVVAYLATAQADYWVEVGADGQPLAEVEVSEWADLPRECHQRPGGDRRDRIPTVYSWGPVWYWYDPSQLGALGPVGCHCGPFETEEEAEDDLAAFELLEEKERKNDEQ